MNEVEPTTLSSKRLVLQPLRAEDAAEMVGVLADPQLYEIIGGQPSTLDELRARYHRLARGRSDDGTQIWLNWIIRVRSGNAAVGTVQATLTSAESAWQARIAWVVGLAWQRQGIASEAAKRLVEWLEQRGVDDVSAAIHPQNVASQRVASRAGLVPTDEVVDGEQVWRRSSMELH